MGCGPAVSRGAHLRYFSGMGKVTRLTGGDRESAPEGLQLREISGEAVPANGSVGEDLRNARLQRGDELSQVSQALRISKVYLEALETDRPAKLPGRTYAIGFTRAYANYLGLDAASLVARYKLATTGLAEGAPQIGSAPELDRPRFAIGWPLPALLLTVLLGYGVYETSRPSTPAATKPAGSAVPQRARSNGAIAATQVAAALSRRQPAALPPSISDPAAMPAGQVFGMQNHGSRVVLHARGLTHVLIEGPGGKVYINRLLHPGDVYRVPNLVGLSLTTPNGDAVSVELDGRDMGAAGGSGHITEALSLDPPAIVDRKGASVSGGPDRVIP